MWGLATGADFCVVAEKKIDALNPENIWPSARIDGVFRGLVSLSSTQPVYLAILFEYIYIPKFGENFR